MSSGKPAAADLVIRRARSSDAPAMAEVFVQAWRHGYPGIVPREVIDRLDTADVASWLADLVDDPSDSGDTADPPPDGAGPVSDVATAAGRVVGFVRYGEDPDVPGGGYVFGLYVHPSASGRGVGGLLVTRAREVLTARGHKDLALHVFRDNARARQLYERQGLVPLDGERIEPEYGAPEIRMSMSLQRPAFEPGSPSPVSLFAGGRGSTAVTADLDELLTRHLGTGFPAGYAAAVLTGDRILTTAFGGVAVGAETTGSPVAVTPDTLFDLASLTKVVVTTPLAMLLAQRGDWDLDDPLSAHLPAAPPSPVTLRHCLTHTSGLVWHRPYFMTQPDAAAIRAAVTAELATATPGPGIEYSDLNFMLLGWALEHRTGSPLQVLAREELFTPLDMADSGSRPGTDLRGRVAATEVDGDQRRKPMAVWGSVHDGNAFALGGVSGHAGIFSTLADVSSYARALLRPERSGLPLTAATVREMTTEQARDGDQVRALGWLLEPHGWGLWPPGTFWHTGFTGTSILVAPEWDVAVVVLANAVHPVRQLSRFALLRASLHSAIAGRLSDRITPPPPAGSCP